MSIITIVGIDPGLVHTGCVALTLDSGRKSLRVEHEAVAGASLQDVIDFTRRYPAARVFIEKYRDRGTAFSTHGSMRAFEVQLRSALRGSELIDNTGVKKVITRQMMQALDCWTFPATNHQDLQAAARIALYGAVKDPDLNAVVYQYLSDYSEGQQWQRL